MITPLLAVIRYFNPRSPCGERPEAGGWSYHLLEISIHAPRVGSDNHERKRPSRKNISIHAPRVGSDEAGNVEYNRGEISIHAPRVGSDHRVHLPRCHPDISIHAPRVGSDESKFLKQGLTVISIHAPRVGSDLPAGHHQAGKRDFNPRSPCGERLSRAEYPTQGAGFQSTLPVWGATQHPVYAGSAHQHFNPRSPCGERPDPPSDTE